LHAIYKGDIMASIKVTIPMDDQESVKVEGIEYSGPGCTKDIDTILFLIGGEAERHKTSDYYRTAKVLEKDHA